MARVLVGAGVNLVISHAYLPTTTIALLVAAGGIGLFRLLLFQFIVVIAGIGVCHGVDDDIITFLQDVAGAPIWSPLESDAIGMYLWLFSVFLAQFLKYSTILHFREFGVCVV